jgi:hypothetical protein
MKHVTKDELIRNLEQKNAALRADALRAASNIDYIAMVTGVELETEGKEETGNEQQV